MDETIILQGRDSDRVAKAIMAQYDGPAYIRRAKQMESACAALEAMCRETRREMLQVVGLRLATLHALAGSWSRLVPVFLTEDDAEYLRRLHDELAPQLALPVESTDSPGSIRHALEELREALEWFNRRWSAFLEGLDLTPINHLIAGYNRWYVLEKECAVGSPRVAREGFRPVAPLTVDALKARFPSMHLPSLKT